MAVLGLQLPPAEELMPGPIAEAGALPASFVEHSVDVSQNGEGHQVREQERLEPGIG
jgi:hypothetical protein